MARKAKKAGSQDFLEQKDTSNHVFQRDKLKNDFEIKIKHELTQKQEEMRSLIKSKGCQILFINGSAGTSKTYTSVLAGLELLSDKKVSDITYFRSAVECTSHGLGYAPGTIEEKINMYLEPMHDKMREFLDMATIDRLITEKRVEGKPINYLRGASWNVKYVILDEAQQLTFKELLTVMTRVGKFTKLIIAGDSMQADIKNSGFLSMMQIFDNQESRDNGIHIRVLGKEDIVRSGVIQYIITQVERYHQDKINQR